MNRKRMGLGTLMIAILAIAGYGIGSLIPNLIIDFLLAAFIGVVVGYLFYTLEERIGRRG